MVDLRKYVTVTHDVIIKTSQDEIGGIIVHNNRDFNPGAVLTEGAIKLIRTCLLEKDILNLKDGIQKVGEELGIQEDKMSKFTQSVSDFFDGNPAFALSAEKPNASEITSVKVSRPELMRISDVLPLETETGEVSSRQVGGRSIQFNRSGLVLPKESSPVIKEPILLGLPYSTQEVLRQNVKLLRGKLGSEAVKTRRNMAYVMPPIVAGKVEPDIIDENPEHPACGACGVCGGCALCAAVNYAAAAVAATAVVALNETLEG